MFKRAKNVIRGKRSDSDSSFSEDMTSEKNNQQEGTIGTTSSYGNLEKFPLNEVKLKTKPRTNVGSPIVSQVKISFDKSKEEDTVTKTAKK